MTAVWRPQSFRELVQTQKHSWLYRTVRLIQLEWISSSQCYILFNSGGKHEQITFIHRSNIKAFSIYKAYLALCLSAVLNLCCFSFLLMWGLRKPSLFLELWVKSWTSVRLSWTRRSVEVWSWFWNILKDWQNWIWVSAVSPMTAWICCSQTSTKHKTLSEWLRNKHSVHFWSIM